MRKVDRGPRFRFVSLADARRLTPYLKKAFAGRIRFWDCLNQQQRHVAYMCPTANEVTVTHVAREVKVFCVVACG